MEFGPIHNRSSCYSEEEAEACGKEALDTINLWNAFIDDVTSDDVYHGIHPPPAIVTLLSAMIEGYNPLDPIQILAPRTDIVTDAMQQTQINVMSLANTLFRFGQFTASRGLLYANLTPCKCEAVSDEALAKQIAQWSKEKPTGGSE